jgi:type VI secretion system protein ImpM
VTALRGFFGKIPGHGDFIDRGLAAGFKDKLDEWLQHGLASSRAVIGDDWLNVYLTSPVWRFTTCAGACGSQAWAGVLVPSVDRVGRYFPLVIAAEIAPDVVPLQVVTAGADWFDGAEAIAFNALEHDTVDAEALASSVGSLGEISLGGNVLRVEPASVNPGMSVVSMPLTYGTSPGQGLLALTHRMLEARFTSSYTLWWTLGSELVHPGIVCCAQLPPPECYAALLHDAHTPPGWERIDGYTLDQVDEPPPAAEAAPMVAQQQSTPVPEPVDAVPDAPPEDEDITLEINPPVSPVSEVTREDDDTTQEVDPITTDPDDSTSTEPEPVQVSAEDILADLGGGEPKEPA